MSASDIIFYIFAALTLACGCLVIYNPVSRNPVTSAMFLVLTIVSMSGLFVLLHAFFLAAVQILVYAGAVIVLFLFVIMLLDLKEEQRRHVNWVVAALSVIVVMVIAAAIIWTIWQTKLGDGLDSAHLEGSLSAVGHLVFGKYILPFEILSLVLLVAMVGVILLSKKELK